MIRVRQRFGFDLKRHHCQFKIAGTFRSTARGDAVSNNPISLPYNAKPGGLIVLGNSAYPSDDYVPGFDHSSDHPQWVIENWPDVSRTFKAISRALTDREEPTAADVANAWRGDVGFANYVGESTARGSKTPTAAQYRASRAAFRPWINKYRPARMLVCGAAPTSQNGTYDWLPENPEVRTTGYTPVAYRLNDGSHTICHGITHPRASSWKAVRDGLKELRHWQVIDDRLVRAR